MVAPTGWKEVRLGDLGPLSKGVGIRKNEVTPYGIPCVRYGQIYTDYNFVIGEIQTFVSPQVASNSRPLRRGEILFAGSGETKEDIGKCIAYVEDVGAVAGGDIIVLTPEGADPRFLGYSLNSPNVAQQKMSRAQGDAVVHISAANLASIVLDLPPLKEQEAIANALSDADAAVESLNALIAKKRDVKQATMQQLLAGRTRLPGFNADWKEVRLGDLGVCLRGVSYKGDSDLSDGDTPTTVRLLRSNNVQNSLIQFNDVQYVNHDCVSDEQILRRDDIVICMANGSKALVGKTGLYKDSQDARHTFGAFMGCFRSSSDQAHAIFVRYLFLTKQYQDYISNLLAGSSINNLTPKSIESLLFTVPPLMEQEAIAEALSVMDQELEALTQQVSKLRMVKEGMMQDLLTGEVRLV